jgi:polyhydroxybutyrate depolymerase
MRHSSLLVLVAAASIGCGGSPAGAPDASSTLPPSGSADAATATGSGSATPASCTGKAALSGDSVWTLTSGGIPRVVDLHVPPGYDPTTPIPIVLNFHGFTSDPIQEEVLSLMDPEADAANFIVLYPLGTGAPLSWNAGACCGTAAATGVDDIQFVRDILDQASAQLCVDSKRVYATGMSNGGFLTHRIGCELADRFAAIAPVAGVLGVPTCTPSRPVPVMHFHGTADPLVPWNGSSVLGFISVPDSIAGWVARDHCTGSPVQTYSHGDASCSSYQQCDGGAEVTLCTIDGGGHTWPGGTPVPSLGYTSTDLSATDAMWTFFAAHPMP